MNRRRKRVTYRPSKGESGFAGSVGVVFVIIGLFVIIPTFGPFGILWTLIAVGITVMNWYRAFGSKYIGPEITIEDEEGLNQPEGPSAPPAAPQPSAEERLRQLEDLREKRLITANEFEEKRKEILKEL